MVLGEQRQHEIRNVIPGPGPSALLRAVARKHGVRPGYCRCYAQIQNAAAEALDFRNARKQDQLDPDDVPTDVLDADRHMRGLLNSVKVQSYLQREPDADRRDSRSHGLVAGPL
jgi:hypothetical protein